MLTVVYTAPKEAPDLKVNIYENAGIDLFVTKESLQNIVVEEEFKESIKVFNRGDDIEIKVFDCSILHIDVPYKFAFPKGVHGLVFGRSGNFFKKGIDTFKGVIDSSYRGFVKVGLIFYKRGTYIISPNTAIAQLVLINATEAVRLKRVTEEEFLSYNSSRGIRGFGSTGNIVK